MNKDNAKSNTAIRVFTPSEIKSGLSNLPFNYVVAAKKVLKEWFETEQIDKEYSERYIIKVKQGYPKVFNKHIVDALVHVGLENLEDKERYGLKRKRKTSTN